MDTPTEHVALRARYRAFMEEHVYPNEEALSREDEASDELIAALRDRARQAGLWAPHLPPEAGGTGLGFMAYASLNEEIGRVSFAQLVFNCQAPDAGNGEILHLYGTDEQKKQWLAPLVEGEARSFFSMTEPEVSGADPTGLRTTAVLESGEWVIDGRKWFSTAAEGAAFGIVMAVSEPEAPPHRRMSQIIVPADAPGVEIEAVPVLGHRGRGWSTHCEVRYHSVRVPEENLLGARGDGFAIAQRRLGPGRIHHVMRWLGQMQRAFELMCGRALEREAFGGPLAEKQTVQAWIADAAAGIHACRLMTYDAARKIDAGADARVEISLIKFFAADVLSQVIDRAVQVHGGARADGPLAALGDVLPRPWRPHLRRSRRGAPDGRQPAHPEGLRLRRRLDVRLTRSPARRSETSAAVRSGPPWRRPDCGAVLVAWPGYAREAHRLGRPAGLQQPHLAGRADAGNAQDRLGDLARGEHREACGVEERLGVAEEGGVGEARSDGADAQAASLELRRDAAHEADHRVLGQGVERVVGKGHDPGERRRGDDHAARAASPEPTGACRRPRRRRWRRGCAGRRCRRRRRCRPSPAVTPALRQASSTGWTDSQASGSATSKPSSRS